METRNLGPLANVSRYTLGGGGIGQLWGATTRDEAVATVRAAADAGINLFDMAPKYAPVGGQGEAEEVIGAAFEGHLPEGARVTSKCLLGETPPTRIGDTLKASIAASLTRMRVERINLFFLHSNVVPDDHPMRAHADAAIRMTPYSAFVDHVRPAFEALIADGVIGAWGLTGIGHPATIMRLLGEQPAPAAVQCIANPLDSAGGLKFYAGPTRARDVAATARRNGVGVLGIRVVQAGALADGIDRALPDEHPETLDFHRAGAFRALARDLECSAAHLAHRYALSMADVDTVVLGVKNRNELTDCLAALDTGPLAPEAVARVDGCFEM